MGRHITTALSVSAFGLHETLFRAKGEERRCLRCAAFENESFASRWMTWWKNEGCEQLAIPPSKLSAGYVLFPHTCWFPPVGVRGIGRARVFRYSALPRKPQRLMSLFCELICTVKSIRYYTCITAPILSRDARCLGLIIKLGQRSVSNRPSYSLKTVRFCLPATAPSSAASIELVPL